MTERPEVTVVEDHGRQRFEAMVGEHVAGWISYGLLDDVVDMEHTVVADEYEDQGIGSALVRGALDQVRQSGRKVKPTCAFVRGYLDDHDEYADVVA